MKTLWTVLLIGFLTGCGSSGDIPTSNADGTLNIPKGPTSGATLSIVAEWTCELPDPGLTLSGYEVAPRVLFVQDLGGLYVLSFQTIYHHALFLDTATASILRVPNANGEVQIWTAHAGAIFNVNTGQVALIDKDTDTLFGPYSCTAGITNMIDE